MLKHRGLLIALRADASRRFVWKAADVLLWKSIFLLLPWLNTQESVVPAFLLIVPNVFIFWINLAMTLSKWILGNSLNAQNPWIEKRKKADENLISSKEMKGVLLKSLLLEENSVSLWCVWPIYVKAHKICAFVEKSSWSDGGVKEFFLPSHESEQSASSAVGISAAWGQPHR